MWSYSSHILKINDLFYVRCCEWKGQRTTLEDAACKLSCGKERQPDLGSRFSIFNFHFLVCWIVMQVEESWDLPRAAYARWPVYYHLDCLSADPFSAFEISSIDLTSFISDVHINFCPSNYFSVWRSFSFL